MKSRALALVLLLSLAGSGCNLFNRNDDEESDDNPTGPTGPTVSMDLFAGTWSSATASTPPTGCGNLKFTVTPTTTTTANVSVNGTCAGGINVIGSGSGTLSGSTITWSASGLVAQGGVNCPFTFPGSKATLGTDNQMVVSYSGTVCGIPVSGNETVTK